MKIRIFPLLLLLKETNEENNVKNMHSIIRVISGRSDYQVDDGMPVVFNWTAIGAVPGALTVAAGAYPFKLIIYRVITTYLALYIYLIRHCAIHYVF